MGCCKNKITGVFSLGWTLSSEITRIWSIFLNLKTCFIVSEKSDDFNVLGAQAKLYACIILICCQTLA